MVQQKKKEKKKPFDARRLRVPILSDKARHALQKEMDKVRSSKTVLPTQPSNGGTVFAENGMDSVGFSSVNDNGNAFLPGVSSGTAAPQANNKRKAQNTS
uniref:Uncharacterized protein n=1 Tax=Lygus hesperus TaxID=30085 RepID=A0A146L686_LYGHE